MNKRILQTFLVMLVTLLFSAVSVNVFGQTVWDGTASTSWYNATDTEFEISTAEELAGLAKLVNEGENFTGKTVKLTADIWLNTDGSTANNWPAIGGGGTSDVSATYWFSGHFDGNYNVIYNLYCNKSGSYHAGLFGVIQGGGANDTAIVKNVIIKNAKVNATSSAGGIVAFAKGSNPIVIKNCLAINPDVTANNGAGIVSFAYQQNNSYLLIENCAATGVNIKGVTSTTELGSLGGNMGNAAGSRFINCYGQGTINNGATSGGKLVGYHATLTNCYHSVSGGGAGAGTYSERTSEEMQSESFWTNDLTAGTFTEDCNGLNNGYPIPAGYLCNVKIEGPEEICSGLTITLTATNGFDEYIWSNGATTESITVTPTVTTTYSVTSTRTEDGATIDGEFTVTVLPNFTFTATAANAHGSITPETSSISCTNPQPITYTITPDEGWYVSKVLVDGEEISFTEGANNVVTGTYTPVANQHGNVTAHFYDKYSVTVKLTLNGEPFPNTTLVSPWGTNGATEVEKGGNLEYTISQNNVYSINWIKLDGTTVPTVTTYSFEDVQSNHILEIDYIVDVTTGLVWDGTADISWYNTTDTEFYIYTAEQLAGIAELANRSTNSVNFQNKKIILMADIWLNADESTERNWVPIGSLATQTSEQDYNSIPKYFGGHFDGNGHIIYNMYCNRGTNYQGGLFGNIYTGCIIEKLGFINPIVRGRGMLGVIAGNKGGAYGAANPVIRNCMVIDADIESSTGNNNGTIIGGTFGTTNGTLQIQNCLGTGSVRATGGGTHVGGLIGNGQNSSISNSYFYGELVGSPQGGLTANSSSATKSYSNLGGSGAAPEIILTFEQMQTDMLGEFISGGVTAFKADCGINQGLPIMDWYICDVDVTGPTEVCADTDFILNASGYDSYIWTKEGDDSFEEEGSSITVSLTETTNFIVKGYLAAFPDLEVVSGYEVTVNENMNITVTTRAYDNGLHGTVDPMLEEISCGTLTPVDFEITPDAGWHVSGIYINGEQVRSSVAAETYPLIYEYTPEDISANIEIHFSDLYMITASIGLRGGADLDAAYLINEWAKDGLIYGQGGEDFTLHFNQTAKYHLDTIYVNGTALSSVSDSYTFTNLNSDANTIRVVYKEECGILSIPYYENFDYYGTGSGTKPDCWTMQSIEAVPYIGTVNNSAPGALMLNCDGGADFSVAILPEISEDIDITNLQATMKVRTTNTSYKLDIGFMYIDSELGEVKYRHIAELQPQTANEWDEFDVFFSNYNNPLTDTLRTLALRFTGFNATGSNAVYVDDFKLMVAPDCKKVSDLVVNSVDGTSATISWAENNEAETWEVLYGLRGFNPETSVETPLIATTNEGFEITGLSPLTEYDVYIKSICGVDEKSFWSKALKFKTTQILAQIPYLCDFSNSEENTNWSLDNGTQTNKWYIGSTTQGSNTVTEGLYISNNDGVGNAYTNTSTSYVYAYRMVNITSAEQYTIEFDWRTAGEAGAYGYDLLRAFLIPVSANPNLSGGQANGMTGMTNTNPSGWVSAHTGSYLGNQNSWQRSSATFNVASPGVYYLVFFWKNDASQGANPPAAVDNIVIASLSSKFAISEIDPDSEIGTLYSTCASNTHAQAVNSLPKQLKITDIASRNHTVDLIWTITGYDGNTVGTYNAVGTFVLPEGVIQSNPPQSLQVTTQVQVNAIPSVSCAQSVIETSINNIVDLSANIANYNPSTDEIVGTAVTDTNFDPKDLVPGSYTITVSREDAATGCVGTCSFVIKVGYPAISEIDPDGDIQDIQVCHGTPEQTVLRTLPSQATIIDSDEAEHTVSLSWSISGYDSNVPADYTATGTFVLPAKVSQSEPAVSLTQSITVTVNEIPSITCPENTSIKHGESIDFNTDLEEGVSYSGEGISGNIFNEQKDLLPGGYSIVYTYTDPQNGCSSSCSFTVTITSTSIASVDTDGDVEDIAVCLGTPESEVKRMLAGKIKIKSTNDVTYTVDLKWTIESYSPLTPGTYTATGTFALPYGLEPSSGIALQVESEITVNALPSVTCPGDMDAAKDDLITLSGAAPAGGEYSGFNVSEGRFDADGLYNGDYLITYLYKDIETGCADSCSFTISVKGVGIETPLSSIISLYPNPNDGNFRLNFGDMEGEILYQLIDAKGSIMFEENIISSQGSYKDFSVDLRPGVYYLKLVTSGETVVKQIVVE